MEVFIPLALVGLLVFQQVFFMRQVQKMIDKIMSRNFVEYKQMETPPLPRAAQPPMPFHEREDFGVLNEFINPLG